MTGSGFLDLAKFRIADAKAYRGSGFQGYLGN